jgi:hypothetical protein
MEVLDLSNNIHDLFDSIDKKLIVKLCSNDKTIILDSKIDKFVSTLNFNLDDANVFNCIFGSSYEIFIKFFPSSKFISVNVKPQQTVEILKQFMCNKYNLDINKFVLIHVGKKLENDHILVNHNITKDSTIYLCKKKST